jgi:PAS domain S-box-containing protein
MQEIAKVTLENELDLILAHKRTMKLAELACLSLSAQTTFATAVSEVSRSIIDGKHKGYITLSVETDANETYIVASLRDGRLHDANSLEGLSYAKRLVNKYQLVVNRNETVVQLYYFIAPPFRIDILKLDEWRNIFRNEPPISPYEELKRKNEQLQDLSEKIQKSEGQYRTLTNSLPLIIFSLDFNGKLLYANDWLLRFTGETLHTLNAGGWEKVVHPNDIQAFMHLLESKVPASSSAIQTQVRLRHKINDVYLWHQISLSAFVNEKNEPQYWIGYVVDIHAQKVYEETLKDNFELKETQARLQENQHEMENIIGELNRSNQELEQFAYIASHDLQEPVRKLLFYSDALQKKYSAAIDETGRGYFKNMRDSAMRMRTMILDLLSFSQVNKAQIQLSETDLNEVVAIALQDLDVLIKEHAAVVNTSTLPVIMGDSRMMRQLFENLICNAVKFHQPGVMPDISISCAVKNDKYEIAVADNGIGFDEKYLEQMFHLFQRLHSRDQYEGTGLGLAICRKIVELHKGTIWASSTEGVGSVFYITIPVGTKNAVDELI